MEKPDNPDNELQRIAALHALKILDTGSEPRFDRITRVAKQHFQVPIALVSLVDRDRQWFKSRQGLDATETPRDISFCGHAILGGDIFYVPNALEDPRFADNPLVTDGPKIRFYAGAPLRASEGLRIGTLCIIDDHPRQFTQSELAVLRDLADIVEDELGRNSLLQYQSELQAQKSRIGAILDNVVDGIITIDDKGIVEAMNPAAEKIFGYQANEVCGQNVKMLMPNPYQDQHDGYLQNYLTSGERKIIGIGREVEGLRKNGTTFSMELAVSQMEVAGERMFTGIVRDISERKQAEQALRDREGRISAILENVVDGIITIDAQGSIEALNPAAERIFGYSEGEVQGKNVKLLMPEPYQSQHDGYLQNYLGGGERKVIGIGREVEGLRKDGSIFPMELSVSEMEVNGERMFTGIVRDITERKKVELMKSEFISTVSHELRTPLTSIRGALGLVLGKAGELLPPKPKRMLEMAERNSERLTFLINDILDLEKIEAGRLQFECSNLDLLVLAYRAVEDNEGYARQHNVKLRVESRLTSAPVYADAHRLLQVFANSISNAIKYSPTNGEVVVRIAPYGDMYRASMIDQGAGIPDEFRHKIFQRFAQADSSDTREKGGSGLGLSISKAIVDRMNGDIGFSSKLGKGSCFYFDLPKLRGEVLAEETPSDASVLICEDNQDVAEILAEMLDEEGISCDIATSANVARTKLQNESYRLLLLDLTLPDVDGLLFIQELRDTPETSLLPIIVVSGRASEGRASFNGDVLTVVDWLQKPIDRERLQRAINAVFSQPGRPHILHVEDDPDIVQITSALLEEVADLSSVASIKTAREKLAEQHYDLVLLDLELPDGSGVELLDGLKGHCPVVIFSAQTPDGDVSRQVTAALTKSMTTNFQLLATVKNILNRVD